jgi:hypothetical protein
MRIIRDPNDATRFLLLVAIIFAAGCVGLLAQWLVGR